MDTPLVEVDFRGIRVIGPESFMCAVLVWEEESRVLPVWLSPIDAAELSERTLEEGSGRRRPTTRDVLADVLSRYDGGVAQLALTSSYEGVFIGEIQTSGGEEVDARASDVLILSQILDLPLLVAEEVLAQMALHIADDELQEYLDLTLGTGDEDSAPGVEEAAVSDVAAKVDAELEELLRELGAEDPEEGEAGDDEDR